MNVTRTGKFENGKFVYYPPLTKAEIAADKQRFAEMCQARRGPALNGTDRAFLEGDVIHHGLQHLRKEDALKHVEMARKAGIDITGKVYKSGLSDQRGPADPMAWVGSRDDVINACIVNKKRCRGSVTYQGPELPPEPDCPLSEKVIRDISNEYVAANPDLSRKPHELREMVIEKHGAPAHGKKKKKGNYDQTPDP